MDETLKLLLKLFVNKIIKKLMCKNINFWPSYQKLWNGTKQINKCNKCMWEEKVGKYFELCWFSKICDGIKSFPELKQNIGKYYITSPISSRSIAIEWRNEHIIKLES